MKPEDKKILIVEDESSLLQAISIKLKKSGYTVLEANDGQVGLATALKNRPNVIILDIMMPQMDGLTMLHKLREDQWGKLATVIIFTNFDLNDERLAKIVIDKPTYYLMKSTTSLEDILDKVRDLLNTHEQEVQTIIDFHSTDTEK